MKHITGVRLESLPEGTMYHIIDNLLYCDDPKSFVLRFESNNNKNYLYYWCDKHEDLGYNRCLIVETNRENVVNFFNGYLSLCHLFMFPKDNVVYVVDVDKDSNKNIIKVNIKHLPKEYLPKHDYYNEN